MVNKIVIIYILAYIKIAIEWEPCIGGDEDDDGCLKYLVPNLTIVNPNILSRNVETIRVEGGHVNYLKHHQVCHIYHIYHQVYLQMFWQGFVLPCFSTIAHN